MPHHRLRPPVPEQLPHRSRLRLVAAQQPSHSAANVECVQARPKQHDGRRRDNKRGQRTQCHGGNASVGERREEIHREQRHRRDRKCHRRRRKHHGPPRGDHRLDERLIPISTLGELIAITADDQQRVIDGQCQPQGSGQVQGENRHIGGHRDQTQHRQGSDDSQPTDDDRQRRRQQAPEHPQKHRKTHRYRDRFHLEHIPLGL